MQPEKSSAAHQGYSGDGLARLPDLFSDATLISIFYLLL